jgi:hypothetical protein
VFIYGASGEELIVYDSGIIETPEFPDRLTRLTVDTFIPFRNRTNGYNPSNGVRIDLDFTSPRIVDWQFNVSGPTPNSSEVLIQGHDDGWRAAILSFLQRLFAARSNHRGFLHAAFTYDIYLWLLFMPVYFYGVIQLDGRMDSLFSSVATPIRVAVYVYTFFIFANLYRLLIGYIRWTFPSIELKDVRSTQTKHRRFWGFLATAIIIPVLLSAAIGK